MSYQNKIKVISFGIKRTIDILLSILGLILLAPLLGVISLLIKFHDGGPIFYQGIRCGLMGNPFRIYKFRTMVVNADSIGGPTTGTKDPRVTKIGGYLRKYKFDELPQMINVIRGEMSIVGPRPEVYEYTSKYTNEELIILTMKPGITDNSSIEFINLDDIVGTENPDKEFRMNVLPRKNKMRVEYVKNWTFSSDIIIIIKTLINVFKKILW